eukprot:CAMPEP_0204895080 /NCGR_PEP_ID=MMETSP1349-20130617/33812_1 /ASSEMBLY_ACC=CAM_ASM_000710 /TAXON_ID=215587 /ORGANISM="Aplanochytrium stocchinoi, Strain GSBS06" /LENGTH=156 /DNA_ID=CAMNT_0052062389 /DNA_START=2222 /DNA_END=2690 /DNA_ORIENTATION=-
MGCYLPKVETPTKLGGFGLPAIQNNTNSGYIAGLTSAYKILKASYPSFRPPEDLLKEVWEIRNLIIQDIQINDSLADHIQNHKVRRTQVMEEILPQNVNTQSFPDFRASLMGQNAGAYDLMMQNLQGQKAAGHTLQNCLTKIHESYHGDVIIAKIS